MKKLLFLLSVLFLLNGCAESVAFLSSSISGASSGKMLQSSLNSVVSYGVKQHTGKSPLEHAIAYAEEKNPEKKKDLIVKQIYCSVKWRESLIKMSKNGVEKFVDIGPGKVLSGMVKRTIKNSKSFSINSIADINDFKNEFKR